MSTNRSSKTGVAWLIAASMPFALFAGSSSLEPPGVPEGPPILAPGPGGLPEGATGSLMWVVENQSDQVFAVDVTGLVATLIGSAGVDVGFGGLGYHPASDTLYCWNTSGASLYEVDRTTGAFTLVGSGTVFGADTFDIRPTDGAGIAWSVAEELHDIDLGSGASSFRVDTTGIGLASAFGPDGTYYNLDRANDTLYTVDVDTGTRTAVGPLGLNVNSTSLAFNPDDGFLYSIEIGDATYPLYRIDPATGAATVVGNVSGLPDNAGQQVTMATFLIFSYQPPIIQEIPTLGARGLTVLALLLGALALIWARRRGVRA